VPGLLEISLLGPLSATIDGERVELRPGRARIVLARLALEGDRTVPRAALIRSLWDDDPPASAVNVVQVAVSSLRRQLGAAAVTSSPAGYALGPASVDLADLLDGVRRGARAADTGDDVAVGTALAPVLERFRPPLEDLGESRFVAESRRWITERFLTAVELYSGAAVRTGRADTVVGLLPDLVATHPMREGLLEQLVLALGAVGRETEAIAAYDAGRLRIVEELGLDPGTRLRSAYERVIRNDLPPQGAAAVHGLRMAPAAATSSLIGRTADLEALARLLDRPDVRLLSVVGPAGIGKSRLAESVLQRVAGAMARVSGATTAEALAEAVVRDVVEPRPAGDPFAALVQVLRGRRRTLLALDDLASGPASTAFVDDLLTAVPGLQVVVTARRPLRVPSEHRFPVLPLATDPRDGVPSPAAEVLLDRIARDRGGRSWGDDRGLIEDIARLCDGVPLALELAAAATAVRSVEEVRDGLARSAAGGWAPHAEHGGALARAMRSGLADLPQDALALLGAAACFVDGGDVPALAEVAGFDVRAGETAAAELRDRGLVVVVAGGGRLRLRILGPVREAVLAGTDRQLLDSTRGAFVARFARRHCGHEWFDRVPRTPAEVVELAAELGDLRVALATAVESGSSQLPRMVARLAWASTVLATGEEWRRWRAAALALPAVSDEDGFDLVVAAPDGPAALDEARRIAERLRDPSRTGWLRFREARTALDRGDVPAAQGAIAELTRAVAEDATGAADFLRARLLDARQMLAVRLGRADESLELTELAMADAVEQGRLVEAEQLENVRIEGLIAVGRVQEAADGALDLLERTASASPWLRGATLSLRGVALLQQGAVGAAVDAQRTSVGLMLGSPWRIERLEVLARWAAARLADDAGDRDAGFVLGVWSSVMRRLGLAPWPIEQAIDGGADGEGGSARRAGEQAVRLAGPDRAVEDAMRAILDGRRLVRERG
jgi:DNA-binding SARP family transcriptional activator